MSTPALLVSYAYLTTFLRDQGRYAYRDWVMDSGAFTAFASGKTVDLQAYIDTCKRLLEIDPKLTEVYALDVIGDWRGTVKNTEEMWRQGVPAIPCYHIGSPEDVLKGLARDYPKVALGGVAAATSQKKDFWAQQCFARIWPCKVHGFGFGSGRSIMALPWHSVDATTWEIGPCRFGRWKSFGKLNVRGSQQDLRGEVQWYLKLEERARTKWKKQMLSLNAVDSPTIRLAIVGSGREKKAGLLN